MTARQVLQLSEAVRNEQDAAGEPDRLDRDWLWRRARLLRRSAGQTEEVVRRSQAEAWRVNRVKRERSPA